MSNDAFDGEFLRKTLMENWRREMEAAQLYQNAARLEKDARRRDIFEKLAQVERNHADLWAKRLEQEGVSREEIEAQADAVQSRVNRVSDTKPADKGHGHARAGLRTLLQRIEDIEQGNAAWYQSLGNVVEDEEIQSILQKIDADEAAHQNIDKVLQSPNAEGRLKKMWRGERHSSGSSDWVGDAVYGVNDGLGAIFGIISGVAGYTSDTHTVLVSGLFGALASTLSMGAGAWLSTKSENEVMETTLAQERREIEEDPTHEIEELALLYQLKGFDEAESARIALQISQDKDQFLKTMVQEEFGFHESSFGNPWRSSIFGGLSTLVGGVIPLIPFFFMQGWPAFILAAIISILAHFGVGAAKSVITVRGWFVSGLEMTFVGIIVGVASYGLGFLAQTAFGAHLG